MSKIRKIFLSHPRGYIAGGIISTAMFLLCLFIKNNYKLIGFIDAIGYSFLFTFFISLLVLVTYWGAFDTLSYGLYYVFNHKSQKYESLSNYCDVKNLSRKKSPSLGFNTLLFRLF